MTKKIALLSVHADPNYGSQLQAFALQKSLSKLGVESEYLQFTTLNGGYSIKWRIRSLLKKILTKVGLIKLPLHEYSYWESPEFAKQRKLFDLFHKNILVSDKIYHRGNVSKSNDEYLKFIVGSDQLWSPAVEPKRRYFYFLDFVCDNSKKNSYAPSIGTVNLSTDTKALLKEKLESFSNVSCRERANADTLSKLIGRKVEYVLDPTLLLNNDEWMQLSESIKMPDDYILCYILGTKKCLSDYAQTLGRQNNIPVYYIVTRPEYINYPNALRNVSVGQFLSLISKASCVITDSFHGTMFSINLGVNFYSFSKRESNNSILNDNDRLLDILSVLGLENRYKDDTDLTYEGDIVYDKTYDILRNLRESSLMYLKNIVKQNE